VSQKLIGINGVLTIGLILISVINFNRLFYRAVLAVWGGWTIIDTVLTLGSRTKAAVFLLTLFFAYKRLIGGRSVAGVIFFVFIFLFSLLYFEIIRAGLEISDLAPALSKASEFQSLLSTSYDILARKESGTLSEVPVGLYFADFVRFIPQQILPFAKVDQAEWYLGEIGIRGSGSGYMFGVLSEAAVGFGVLELLFRGFFLGAILAGIHNWYFRRRTSFWPLVFYIWCCVTVYYTYRAGTLYSLSFILTYFVPAYLLYRLCKYVITRSKGGHLL